VCGCAGSPISEGKFQFDLWGVTPTKRWDWDSLRAEISESPFSFLRIDLFLEADPL
jgi:hypothetical protein